MIDARIQIEHRMNIIRADQNGGFVLVPGLEPASTLTSTRMAAEMQRAGLLECSIVPVKDLLEAIPGSRVEFVPNYGRMGNQRLLVLPAFGIDCPCGGRWPDFYEVMRDLCRAATEDEKEEIQKTCDAFSIDSCQDRPQWRGQS